MRPNEATENRDRAGCLLRSRPEAPALGHTPPKTAHAKIPHAYYMLHLGAALLTQVYSALNVLFMEINHNPWTEQPTMPCVLDGPLQVR